MNKSQNPTDSFLILQYQKGNKKFLSELVKRYHQTFCEKAYWLTKDKDIAKDIAQESWIVIIDKLHTLKNTSSFKSWASRIVYTNAIDLLKDRIKEKKNAASDKIITSDTMECDEKNKDIQKALLKAIRKLPKEKQEIIRLFYAEEFSINEISTFLVIPKGTVKSRLFKAREKLKLILKKYQMMKNKMEEIDQLIKETLSKEEAAFFDSLEEQNLFDMVTGLFKGKNAWFLIVVNILIFVLIGFFIYCCTQFFKVESTTELIKWGFGGLIFFLSISILKIYAWMQMDKNAILREMKRLELQVMSLYGKIVD